MKSLAGFILFIAFHLIPNVGAAAPSCRSLFREVPTGYFVSTEPGNLQFVQTLSKYADSVRGRVGRLDYDYNEATHTLLIEWIHVDPKMRELGINNHMLAELLKMYPETNQVIGYLTDHNFQIFEQAYLRSNDSISALMSTPFFRSLSAQGFDQIHANEYYDGKVAVALRKTTKLP